MTVLTRTRLRGAVVTMLAAVELATTGCASGGAGRGDDVTGEDTRDAAGKTQAQVANLSLKDEFDSAGERYEHGQAVLAAAQQQISDAAWYWNGGDVRPLPAGDAAFGEAPDGATKENSYSFRGVRIIGPDGATGAEQNLEPRQRYFDEEGWRSRSAQVGTDHEVRAGVTWSVRPNGQYSLGVYSEAVPAGAAPPVRRFSRDRVQPRSQLRPTTQRDTVSGTAPPQPLNPP